jgi:2-dehydro-3-deoxyphosphogluconate aldolase / (4S)-4-hydroxy-2-oxoglutarate aldolase
MDVYWLFEGRMTMEKPEKMERIQTGGVIAILRAKSSDQLIASAEAILAGGVNAIEVTMNTPGALEVIESAVKRFGDEVLFGAGTVLDAEVARTAILAGASFVVAPTFNIDTVNLCIRYGVPVMPGCFTPTEMMAAWQEGADFIKLFPAEVGGPAMVKALLAPLPEIRIIPVGGVDLNNAAAYIRAGAVALGVGSSLFNQKLMEEGNFAEMTRRAAGFIAAVKEGRGDMS